MPTVVWINGAFGVGKSTTALHVALQNPQLHFFDPEWVGYMLRANLHGVEFDNFQDLPAWRNLVPPVAHQISLHVNRDLLAVQTVLKENYWSELHNGLTAEGFDIVHVLLDCDESELRKRIENDTADEQAKPWRLGHIDEFLAARPWLVRTANVVIDVTSSSPEDAAAEITRVVTSR